MGRRPPGTGALPQGPGGRCRRAPRRYRSSWERPPSRVQGAVADRGGSRPVRVTGRRPRPSGVYGRSRAASSGARVGSRRPAARVLAGKRGRVAAFSSRSGFFNPQKTVSANFVGLHTQLELRPGAGDSLMAQGLKRGPRIVGHRHETESPLSRRIPIARWGSPQPFTRH